MTNNRVLEITIENVTKILTRRWDDAELAKKEVDEILEEFEDEITEDNIFNTVVTLENLL